MRTTRTLAISIATLVGVGAGSYGIVAATDADAPPAQTDTDTDTDTDDVEEQDPQLGGSIQIDDVEDESEADEDARLQELATVSEADAKVVALAEFPGDISETELGNENGSVVWEFEIVGADGSTVEVKIDAANATVLDIETDDDDENDDDDVENESEHDGDDASDPDAANDD
ncbi:MAG: PepSY domain-containing protein [Ilumatobacter sp.]